MLKIKKLNMNNNSIERTKPSKKALNWRKSSSKECLKWGFFHITLACSCMQMNFEACSSSSLLNSVEVCGEEIYSIWRGCFKLPYIWDSCQMDDRSRTETGGDCKFPSSVDYVFASIIVERCFIHSSLWQWFYLEAFTIFPKRKIQ